MTKNRICKTHLRSIGFKINAGMDFPICKANARLVDIELSNSKFTAKPEEVTCESCKKIMAKNRG